MQVLLLNLFIFARVNFCPFVSPSLCQGLAAACDCSPQWTFLLTFYDNLEL